MASKRTEPTPANSQPLAGRTVVITRAQDQADQFVAELEKYGAKVVLCPTIEICALETYERLDEAIEHLYGYDWLIFTSVNGVDYFFRRLKMRARDVSDLDDLKVCAIGDATADKLRDLHVHVDVIPEDFVAEGVFRALERFVGGAEGLQGLNILLPRASVARDYLPKALEDAGARVDVVPAYRTVLPANLDRGRVGAMLSGDADCIAFTSSSTVRNLARLFDTQDLSGALSGVVVACIGDITATTAGEYGLSVKIQPREFTIPALAQAIAEYFSAGEN
ncbi:MAG TPA: uroporphyrinogen-III synthase [Pyrinomonadaceae bacterium]|nr:uroporphyrinogen-III synthase [Pyrinomonadaceae bacterium]